MFLFMLMIYLISCLMGLMVFMKSPLMGALGLVIISSIMAIYLATLSSKWMSYLIILLFLGGMMVLFVYVCTLISNFKNSIKGSPNWFMLSIFFSMTFSSYLFFMMWDFKFDLKNLLLSTMYLNSSFLLMMMIIIYLIFVLVISIKICQKSKGGLKSKIYGI